MRKIITALAVSWIAAPLLSAPLAAAAESPFAGCPDAGHVRKPTNPQYAAFTLALKDEFDQLFKLSDSEIQQDIDCLNGAGQAPDCASRLDYFENTVPRQWAQYREELALSAWDLNFLGGGQDGGPIFNYRMAPPNALWVEQVPPKPLSAQSPDEITPMERKFTTESKRIFKIVSEDAAAHMPNFDAGSMEQAQYQMGIQILQRGNWGEISRSDNFLAVQARSKFETVVFHLNKKRLIQGLMAHPILAFLDAPVVTKTTLIQALEAMRHNLNGEKETVAALLKNADQSTVGWSEFGHWTEFRLDPLMDYLATVQSLVNSHPEFCTTATHIYKNYQEQELAKAVLTTGVTLGAMLFAPPVLAATGAVLLQGYMLYEGNQERKALIQSAFTNPAASLRIRSVDEAYMKADEELTNAYLAPLALASIPALRISRIITIFR